jgi:hypothetical protein
MCAAIEDDVEFSPEIFDNGRCVICGPVIAHQHLETPVRLAAERFEAATQLLRPVVGRDDY